MFESTQRQDHDPSLKPLANGIKSRAALAEGYTSGFRKLEILSFVSALALLGVGGVQAWPRALAHPGLFVAAAACAAVAADFVSGLIHWGCDTWGSTDVPLIGNSILRSFREHHVDPESITRHDIIEVTGTATMASLPLLAGAMFIGNVFWASFLWMLAAFVILTNLAHRWAHQPVISAPVRFLQKNFCLLSPETHARHHSAPYDRYYCITFGWLNGPFEKIQFWRRLERLITYCTGVPARSDDQAYFN